MEYKKAIEILISLLDKYALNVEEKEAVLTAIGTLDWSSMAKSSIKRKTEIRKIKQEKSVDV